MYKAGKTKKAQVPKAEKRANIQRDTADNKSCLRRTKAAKRGPKSQNFNFVLYYNWVRGPISLVLFVS
uniref:Putative ovule protein n=1 Tax=Solanum chacoense TaxID=4108 RepID=A0A0V0GRE6_SOLCH